MTPKDYVMKLIIDGYVVVPDIFVGDELGQIRAAYERRTAVLGKRGFMWDKICTDPDLMQWYGHPNFIQYAKPFYEHYGHEIVIPPVGSYGDAHKPEGDPPQPVDPQGVARGEYEMHNDPWLLTKTSYRSLAQGFGCLLYLDETFSDSGAFMAAKGSHNLTYVNENGLPVYPTWELVKEHCELSVVPVKAGSGIFQLAFNWHGATAARQTRRMCRFNFLPRGLYWDQREVQGDCGGIRQWTEEEAALLRPDAHWLLPGPDPLAA